MGLLTKRFAFIVFVYLDKMKQSNKTKADENASLSGTPSEHSCFGMICLHHLD